MRKGGRIDVQAKKKKRETNYTVGKKKNISTSVECHSFTGENEISSPSPKRKKLRMSMSSVRVPSEGAKWAAEVEVIFVDLMYTEVLRGNIYTTSFTPSVWKDIMNNLALQCGLAYSIKKLKAKHGRMKELWRKFHELMVAESGLGWDEATNMPIASPQVWEEIIQKNPRFAEIRHKGCPHYHKLTTIFSGRTATGYAARASTQMPFSENGGGSGSVGPEAGNEPAEGEGGPSPRHAQPSRRTSSFSRLGDDREILIAIYDKIGQSSTSSTAVQEDRLKTIPERMLEPLREIPDLTHAKFLQAIEFLENTTRRRIFLAMTPSERILYLQSRLKW